ncbi:unnamed protein product [Leptosia nina]|uniref:Sodium-coupled monocarboxylate transporter 1 n=1 Tax=Leptosia nina TaxID=320188 RepID=A0AAV1J6Q0_9NEOP
MDNQQENVADIVLKMQKFSWVDYVVFVFMLAISAFVGVYWGFMKKQTTQNDYLLGGRNMKILPVSMSLVASFISGITLLGSPTEVYMYGTQYSYIIIGIFLMSVFMTQIYLPVFHELKMTSNYEYLSLRFDNKVRLFGSMLFVFAMGGLQAVVWTDVIQITVMLGAMALVAIKGTLDVGGFDVVWRRNMDSGRIEAPNWDFNPTARHTFWNLVIGGVIYWLQANAVNQTMVQRYLALPTLRAAKWSVCLFCIGISILYCFCLYCGLLIYARFYNCDPLQTKLAKAKDQLLPLLVMDVLGDLPGLPGVFLAGIFSAALSSLSTSLNSMSAVVLEDFYKPFYKRQLTDAQTNWLLRGVVVFIGVLCLALTFVVEKLGTILQLTMTLEAITMGPQLGVFTMGILMPWVDALGALVGGLVGLILMAWWCLSAQMAIARGHISHLHKPLSVGGCIYNYTAVLHTNIDVQESVEVSPVLHVSYMWYTLTGCLITMSVGMLVSGVNRASGKAYVPPAPKLLAPQIRSLFRDPPHPSEDPFINAYGTKEGGLKAVVWTDVIQTIVMIGAMILVIIKGTILVGGFGEVFHRNWNTSRIEFPPLNFDMTERHSVYAVTIGATFHWIGNIAVNQSMMQRFLALSELKSSVKAVWGFLIGVVFIICLCGYSGLLAYARYHDCDPLNSKLALAKDQLLPVLVMDVLGEWKGLPGVFVAGVFSAALSSLSTGLNSMAAVVLEDFWKPFSKELTRRQTQFIVQSVVIVFGCICVGLVFVVEMLGPVLQLTISLSAASMGPLAGIFLMGLFLPFVDGTSALIGGIMGLFSGGWIAAQSQMAQAHSSLVYVEKERFTYNCTYIFDEVKSIQRTDGLDIRFHDNYILFNK